MFSDLRYLQQLGVQVECGCYDCDVTSTQISNDTEHNLSLDPSLSRFKRQQAGARGSWVRTKHGPGVHGPLLWTGSMDHFHGPGPWTRYHGPGPWTVFFYFYKKVLHQVHGHSKTEIVPKKDLTRRCRPMLTIDHKYLVVLTWRTLCLHMCSRKTVKLS